MTPRWLWPVVGAAFAGLLLGLWLGRGRPVDPVVLARVDTVLAEAPAAKAERDSLRNVAEKGVIISAKLATEAARLKRVADSLRQENRNVAVVGADTANTRDAIHPDMGHAYDTLAAAYTALETAYQAQVEATAHLTASLTLAETRITTLEGALTAARAELVKTKKPSRWGLGCAGGYGASLMGGIVHTSPAIACGVTFRVF